MADPDPPLTVVGAMPTAAALLDQINALLPGEWEAALVLIDKDDPKAVVCVGNLSVATLIGSLRETVEDPGPRYGLDRMNGLTVKDRTH